MTITIGQITKTAEICEGLGKASKAHVLRSIADQYVEKGQISSRQIEWCQEQIEAFPAEMYEEQVRKRNEWQALWDAKDEQFLKWIDFLTLFYVSSRYSQGPHSGHVQWYKSCATELRRQLGMYRQGLDVDLHLPRLERLEGSKLRDKLWACFNSTPLYGVGDLVSIRGNSPTFASWRIIKYSHDEYRNGLHGYQDRKVAQPYKTALVSEVLNATFACRQMHKSKGSTRLYKIVAFSAGRSDETWVCESDIKLVK